MRALGRRLRPVLGPIVRAALVPIGITAAGLALASLAEAQDAAATASGPIVVSFPDPTTPSTVSPAMKMLVVLTVLSIAPAILISMTSFTRIVVVLGFVRQAVGTQNVPPTQVVMALSLVLTMVVMAPVAHRIQTEAVDPYESQQITGDEAWERGSGIVREFLIRQTREDDLALFYELSATERPDALEDVSLHLLVPAFLISELRTGFEMGFLLFLPFVLVDLLVGSTLTSMGMVMLPPTMISTPLKVLLFVLVDGWALLTRALVASFS